MLTTCPDCGSETGKRGWVAIPPKSVSSVATFGRDELCINRWHDQYKHSCGLPCNDMSGNRYTCGRPPDHGGNCFPIPLLEDDSRKILMDNDAQSGSTARPDAKPEPPKKKVTQMDWDNWLGIY